MNTQCTIGNGHLPIDGKRQLFNVIVHLIISALKEICLTSHKKEPLQYG